VTARDSAEPARLAGSAYVRLILTAMLFGALLVGSRGVDAGPAAVLAAAAAWITATALDQRRADRATLPR
jgi:hypothetical protein